MDLEQEAETGEIIGAAITVHRALGPGFVEKIYENALIVELRARNITLQCQLQVPVLYRGVEVGVHQLDLLANARVVVELKAIRDVEPIHFSIVRSYLRATGLTRGLILNFAKPLLEIKRVSPAMRDPLPQFPNSK